MLAFPQSPRPLWGCFLSCLQESLRLWCLCVQWNVFEELVGVCCPLPLSLLHPSCCLKWVALSPNPFSLPSSDRPSCPLLPGRLSSNQPWPFSPPTIFTLPSSASVLLQMSLNWQVFSTPHYPLLHLFSWVSNVSKAGGPLRDEQSNIHTQYCGVKTDGCQFSSSPQKLDLTSGSREMPLSKVYVCTWEVNVCLVHVCQRRVEVGPLLSSL